MSSSRRMPPRKSVLGRILAMARNKEVTPCRQMLAFNYVHLATIQENDMSSFIL
jgi:hypothetical protein